MAWPDRVRHTRIGPVSSVVRAMNEDVNLVRTIRNKK
jgi:hypothetical protein